MKAKVTMRRAVIGEPHDGESAWTHVEDIDPLDVGPTRWWYAWGWDEVPTLPWYSTEPYIPTSHFPPAGGLRIFSIRTESTLADSEVISEPADDATRLSDSDSNAIRVLSTLGRTDEERHDAQTIVKMLEAQPHGRVDLPDRPGQHRTDSIDIAVIVEGEFTAEATDGTTATLKPGDVYVCNGAMHGAVSRPVPNPGGPSRVVFVVIGARRERPV